MGSLPRRESVRAEPSVHKRQISVKFGVEKVRVVVPQLVGVEQALVDDGERRQRADVEAPTLSDDLVRGSLTQNENLLLQSFLVQVGSDENLARHRFTLPSHDADRIAIDRYIAPRNYSYPEARCQRLEVLLGFQMSV